MANTDTVKTDYIKAALDFGFSQAAALDAATLNPRKEVFDMCAANRCGNYGKSWMCPPASGDPEQNMQKLAKYNSGILIQSTRSLDDDFDYEGMSGAMQVHEQLFYKFVAVLKSDNPDALCLGSGGCRMCDECTYPDAPCRHPLEATPSMEAFGLVVSDVCTANNLGYYYGPQTITYTSCILLD